jgi:Fe2+ or Zn2+ uptake regulation protein
MTRSQLNHADRLRRAGLRATGPRLAILAALEQDRRHPSAEQVHALLAEEHPSVSLSTVYSTLETFARVGLIRRVNGMDGKLRVDGTGEDHDHAVCRECGSIFDVARGCVALSPAPDCLPSGLEVLQVRLEYEVLCGTCRKDDAEGISRPVKQADELGREHAPGS